MGGPVTEMGGQVGYPGICLTHLILEGLFPYLAREPDLFKALSSWLEEFAPEVSASHWILL